MGKVMSCPWPVFELALLTPFFFSSLLCDGLQLYEPPRPVEVETDQERSERERLEIICKEVEILLSEGSLARDRYLRALVDAKSEKSPPVHLQTLFAD